MFMVYWSTRAGTGAEDDGMRGDGEAWQPHARAFPNDGMREAMQWMEALRTRQRAGEEIAFVVLSSENPHSVGHPGVADPSPDYDWKKRRR